jgi:hypothetical protein
MELAKADPELVRQLDTAAAADEPIAAVLSLRPGPSEKFVPAEEAESRVHGLLQKVGEEIGAVPHQVHVFPNLGTFSIAAPAQFLRRLVQRDEVATATANQQPGGLLIKPVASKTVERPTPRSRKRK